MKPTSLLIPALGLFASSAISAPILKRSNAAIPRAENLPEGVVTFPDVSESARDHIEGVATDVGEGVENHVHDIITGPYVKKRGEDHTEGVITFPDVSKRGENHVRGVITEVGDEIDGVITKVGDTIDGYVVSIVSKRGDKHAKGVVTFPDVSKRRN